MTSLKFRAWSEKDKTMYELIGFILHKNTKTNTYKTIDIITKSNKIINFDLKDIIIMQSTGLEDENGVEIYEDDILYNLKNDNFIGVIKYVYGVYICGDYNLTDIYDKCHVAGNIYENKELVENETLNE